MRAERRHSGSSALDHDVIPERVEVRDPDDLREDILDDGTAETGHDIFRLFPVFSAR